MMTVQNIEYWVEDGKYTIDGYDFFDTLEELEKDIDRQREEIFGEQEAWEKARIIRENAEKMERLFAYFAEHGLKQDRPYAYMICMDMGTDNDNCAICPLRDVCHDDGEEVLAKRLIENGEYEIG